MFQAPKYFERKSLRSRDRHTVNYLRNFTKVNQRTEQSRNEWGHNPLFLLRFLAFGKC